ncbi:cell wall-associated NlpC family hydrolase [Neobacillus bataviensis]|uniref:Cell wall-associated NlpC family hydrolase n=1 Tax=Neobacillus bataviensis TaxID=220685 RepID=A0A561CTN1_9BACI|nr:C40 family peptidase [Neobacillus bataviensis]TWD94589.1 cell wall-associated NlpC family hydrolase [Neobacillus bataviensis]
MIKKLIKYTVSASIIATMISATPAFANPVTQGQINQTQNQIDDFETKVQQLDNRISVAMEKSQELNDQIKTQQGKIEETKTEITAAQKSLDAHKQVYAERLKTIQLEGKQSMATYAELLLSSDNISEFLTRFTAISSIMQSDTDLLNGLNEKEQALKNAEEKLHNEFAQLQKSQTELASEQQKIEQDKKEIETELAAAKDTLQSQQAQYAEQLAEEARQRAIAQQQAEQARQRAQQQAQQQAQQPTQQAQKPAQQAKQPVKQQTPVSSTPSKPAPPTVAAPPANSGSASAVIAYAKQFLGVPYVWGGSTPSGFDCSGFTSYVFRNAAGINLPRVSRDQQNVGTRISPSQVQPGDLVFRGNPAYHVGIYIGGGQYIHAPQTGDVVKIAAYNPSKFSSAARVLR